MTDKELSQTNNPILYKLNMYKTLFTSIEPTLRLTAKQQKLYKQQQTGKTSIIQTTLHTVCTVTGLSLLFFCL